MNATQATENTMTMITITADFSALASSKMISQPDAIRIYPGKVETLDRGRVDATFDSLALCLDELDIPRNALGKHLAKVLANTLRLCSWCHSPADNFGTWLMTPEGEIQTDDTKRWCCDACVPVATMTPDGRNTYEVHVLGEKTYV